MLPSRVGWRPTPISTIGSTGRRCMSRKHSPNLRPCPARRARRVRSNRGGGAVPRSCAVRSKERLSPPKTVRRWGGPRCEEGIRGLKNDGLLRPSDRRIHAMSHIPVTTFVSTW